MPINRLFVHNPSAFTVFNTWCSAYIERCINPILKWYIHLIYKKPFVAFERTKPKHTNTHTRTQTHRHTNTQQYIHLLKTKRKRRRKKRLNERFKHAIRRKMLFQYFLSEKIDWLSYFHHYFLHVFYHVIRKLHPFAFIFMSFSYRYLRFHFSSIFVPHFPFSFRFDSVLCSPSNIFILFNIFFFSFFLFCILVFWEWVCIISYAILYTSSLVRYNWLYVLNYDKDKSIRI